MSDEKTADDKPELPKPTAAQAKVDSAVSLARLACAESGSPQERLNAASGLAKLIQREPAILLELQKKADTTENDFKETVRARRKARRKPQPSEPQPEPSVSDFVDDFFRWGAKAAGFTPHTRVSVRKTPFQSQTRVREVKKP